MHDLVASGLSEGEIVPGAGCANLGRGFYEARLTTGGVNRDGLRDIRRCPARGMARLSVHDVFGRLTGYAFQTGASPSAAVWACGT
jgi:hypothetical protein